MGQGRGVRVTPPTDKEDLHLVLLSIRPGVNPSGLAWSALSLPQGTGDKGCGARGPRILTTHFFRWIAK